MDDAASQLTFFQNLRRHWQGVLIILIPIFATIAFQVNNDPAARVVYLIVVMLISFYFEPIPRGITAMMPLAALPFMKILISHDACMGYFTDPAVLFVIGFIVSWGLEYNKLTTIFAVTVLKTFGTGVRGLHIFLVVLMSLISFGIPNSIAISFMAPLTRGILEELAAQGVCRVYEDDDPEIPVKKRKPTRVAICYYLSIAYACLIAGTGSLPGSPVNLVTKKLFDERFPDAPDEIDYKKYATFAAIPMLINLILMTLIMQILFLGLFRSSSEDAMAINKTADQGMVFKAAALERYAAVEPMSVPQYSMVLLYIGLFVLLCTRKPIFADGWGDKFKTDVGTTTAATPIIYLFFALPAAYSFIKCWDPLSTKKAPGLITWKFVNEKMFWDLIFVVGFGGSLRTGVQRSGLCEKLADFFSYFKSQSGPMSLLILLCLLILFANVAAEDAVARSVFPGIYTMAIKCEKHPLFYGLPACLVANLGFLTPQASPAMALASYYGNISSKQMLLAGFLPTVTALVVIYVFSLTCGAMVYSDVKDFPDWVKEIATKPKYGTSLLKH